MLDIYRLRQKTNTDHLLVSIHIARIHGSISIAIGSSWQPTSPTNNIKHKENMSDNLSAMVPAFFRGIMQPQARLWAALFGTSLHLLAFRVGEWDLYTVKLVLAVPLTVAGLTGGLMRFVPDVHNDIWTALGQATVLEGSMLGGIFASMLIYRALFHRLNRFPGPFAARLSNFWITSKGAKNMDTYLQVQKLHEKYGDVVRVGMDHGLDIIPELKKSC
jgi:hypothetical protein